MSQYRLKQGGRIDRNKSVSFVFNGKRYQGCEGDTLASALLANGVHLVSRSFKYHRPRGIMGHGWEDPNAQIQLEKGAFTTPNVFATIQELYNGLEAESQNCWPSVEKDIGAINSMLSRFYVAGFYYKTFKWPRAAWETLYEKVIRRAAGMGKVPELPDPHRYEHMHAYCDLAIVGAGPAGITAALTAAKSGKRVMLIEDSPELGGSLLGEPGTIDGAASDQWLASAKAELEAADNVTVLTRTQVAGYYDYNYLVASERVTHHLSPNTPSKAPRERLWKIRAERVLLATGAIERPMVFADNDRPGIMMASSVMTYINHYGVCPGQKIVVFTNNDSAYRAAAAMQDAGAKVVVVDLRAEVDESLKSKFEVHCGAGITGVNYSVKSGIRSVEVHAISADGTAIQGPGSTIECDLVAQSAGWQPTVHLHTQARGKLNWDADRLCFVPNGTHVVNPNASAGAANGTFGLADAMAEGAAAAKSLLAELSVEVEAVVPSAAENHAFGSIRELWIVPTTHPIGEGKKKHFHEYQNDATAADVWLAKREGFESVEHLKRYTNTGRGTDQGKLSNVNGLAIMAGARGLTVPEVGFTTFRPPYTPLTFGAVMGQTNDDTFTPARQTAMHQCHVERGAVFEDVGDWKRPWYFPKHGESMHDAVQRECLAVRQSVGVLDASTLGKIDIKGKDARKFLNMLYTNNWSKLGEGRCRYGLMVNEHGMVFDDGVTTCIGEDHFHMTTTTGGAARVMTWIEEWLQTEWPDWEVYATSVTEQWSVLSINGPKSRELLAELTDIDLSSEAFPFMSMREGNVCGVPARVYRISFTGELTYEVNVPARYGRYVWEQVFKAGEKYDIVPYGTEAMHVLRAEKGFIIAGQDTDGTMTPMDLGMDWIVGKKEDAIGRRSWSRSDTSRAGRKQLVGLLTQDPNVVLPEGTHAVSRVLPAPPMDMIGHVTSSYMSPNCGRSIAMGLIKDGLNRMGQTIDFVLMDGTSVPAKIVKPIFFDEAGERGRD